MAASYADLRVSACSFLLMRNEFASEHGRTVHPRALKTHTHGHGALPGARPAGSVCEHVPSEGKQEAKVLACKREAQFHVAISCFSQSQSDRQLNQSGAHGFIRLGAEHTRRAMSQRKCVTGTVLVLAQLGNVHIYTYMCEPQASLWF